MSAFIEASISKYN